MASRGQKEIYSPDELRAVVVLYNRMAADPNITDLARQLLIDRSTLYHYKGKPEYAEVFKLIRKKVYE